MMILFYIGVYTVHVFLRHRPTRRWNRATNRWNIRSYERAKQNIMLAALVYMCVCWLRCVVSKERSPSFIFITFTLQQKTRSYVHTGTRWSVVTVRGGETTIRWYATEEWTSKGWSLKCWAAKWTFPTNKFIFEFYINLRISMFTGKLNEQQNLFGNWN